MATVDALVSHPKLAIVPYWAVWYCRQLFTGAISLSQVNRVVFICHFLVGDSVVICPHNKYVSYIKDPRDSIAEKIPECDIHKKFDMNECLNKYL